MYRVKNGWNGLSLEENRRYFGAESSEVGASDAFEEKSFRCGGTGNSRSAGFDTGFIVKFRQFFVTREIMVGRNFGGQLRPDELKLYAGDVVLCKC